MLMEKLGIAIKEKEPNISRTYFVSQDDGKCKLSDKKKDCYKISKKYSIIKSYLFPVIFNIQLRISSVFEIMELCCKSQLAFK